MCDDLDCVHVWLCECAIISMVCEYEISEAAWTCDNLSGVVCASRYRVKASAGRILAEGDKLGVVDVLVHRRVAYGCPVAAPPQPNGAARMH